MDKKQQVMDLWRRNFQDTEEFIQFYFTHKYSDEDSLVYEENGKALSAFLMLPYPMSWQNTRLNTSYISGACTLEEARNHGLMTLLLKEAFLEMNKRGIALSTLIPAEEWLFKYYGNLGYVPVFDYSTEEYHFDPQFKSAIPIFSPESYDPDFARSLFTYFETNMQQRSCCIQHTLNDYLSIVEDAYLSGGRLLATLSPISKTATGWALAIPAKDFTEVKEMFYDTPEIKETLLAHSSSLGPVSRVICKIPPQDKDFQSYGMARITDACQMLNHIAQEHPDLSVSLKINDPHLPANDGIYLLARGRCEKTTLQDITTNIETDIPTLTKALLGYHPEQLPQNFAEIIEKQSPYMNLMLD